MVGYVQNAYTRYTGIALEGLLADLGPNYKQSYTNAAGVNIGFGLAVVKDTSGDRDAKLPTATGQLFVGITIRDQFREIATVGGSTTFYYPGDTMSVLTTQGSIWVLPEVNIAFGDHVYFRTTANGPLTTLGAFRNTADSGNADLVPMARFNTSALAGQPVMILLPQLSPVITIPGPLNESQMNQIVAQLQRAKDAEFQKDFIPNEVTA